MAKIISQIRRIMEVTVREDTGIVTITIGDPGNRITNYSSEIHLKDKCDLIHNLILESVSNMFEKQNDPGWDITKEYYYLMDKTPSDKLANIRQAEAKMDPYSRKRYELDFNNFYEIQHIEEL